MVLIGLPRWFNNLEDEKPRGWPKSQIEGAR